MALINARLTRVQRQDGEVILHGTASDNRPDMYETRMSLRLYQNFLRRMKDNGMPLIDVSHYTHGIIGKSTNVYIDGRMLKFSATVNRKSPIGEHLIDKLQDPDFRIRVGFSIAFDDLDYYYDEQAGHMQVYTDGILRRIAVTTIPANPRSRLEAVEMRAFTQLSDATELIGPTFAQYLDTLEHAPLPRSN